MYLEHGSHQNRPGVVLGDFVLNGFLAKAKDNVQGSGAKEGDGHTDAEHRNIGRRDDRREAARRRHLAAARGGHKGAGNSGHQAHLGHRLAIAQGDAVDNGLGDTTKQRRDQRRQSNGLELRVLSLDEHARGGTSGSKDRGVQHGHNRIGAQRGDVGDKNRDDGPVQAKQRPE